jgi:endonuclease YncB( thermonuclease family)
MQNNRVMQNNRIMLNNRAMLNNMALLLFSVFCFFSISNCRASETVSYGIILRVIDGDTFSVKTGKDVIKVRLFGVDCPETSQDFGAQAKKAAQDLTGRRGVKIIHITKDRYKRLIAHIINSEGLNVGTELIKQGYAWHYHRYSQDENLKLYEKQARENKKGLWSQINPVPPWEYRLRKINKLKYKNKYKKW